MDLLDTYAPANCSEKGETEMEIIKAPGIKNEKDYRATVKIWRPESEGGVPNSLLSINAYYLEGGQPAAL